MDKVAQQFEFNHVEFDKDLNRLSSSLKLEQPQELSFDSLELVGGGDGGLTSTPTKGW